MVILTLGTNSVLPVNNLNSTWLSSLSHLCKWVSSMVFVSRPQKQSPLAFQRCMDLGNLVFLSSSRYLRRVRNFFFSFLILVQSFHTCVSCRRVIFIYREKKWKLLRKKTSHEMARVNSLSWAPPIVSSMLVLFFRTRPPFLSHCPILLCFLSPLLHCIPAEAYSYLETVW